MAACGVRRSQGYALYEKTFLVEDYVPERLEMKLNATQPMISSAGPGVSTLRAATFTGHLPPISASKARS